MWGSLSGQCHLLWLWSGPPGPRPTPSSAFLALRRISIRLAEAGRGRPARTRHLRHRVNSFLRFLCVFESDFLEAPTGNPLDRRLKARWLIRSGGGLFIVALEDSFVPGIVV